MYVRSNIYDLDNVYDLDNIYNLDNIYDLRTDLFRLHCLDKLGFTKACTEYSVTTVNAETEVRNVVCIFKSASFCLVLFNKASEQKQDHKCDQKE